MIGEKIGWNEKQREMMMMIRLFVFRLAFVVVFVVDGPTDVRIVVRHEFGAFPWQPNDVEVVVLRGLFVVFLDHGVDDEK